MVCVVEHREIRNVLFVRRVVADEDPLLLEGVSERFSDRDFRRVSIDTPNFS